MPSANSSQHPARSPGVDGAIPGAERLARLARGLVSGIQQRLAAWRGRRDERSTRLALGALDARALRDIGLDRSEIGSVARELAGPAATRIHALHAGREWH